MNNVDQLSILVIKRDKRRQRCGARITWVGKMKPLGIGRFNSTRTGRQRLSILAKAPISNQ